MIDLLNKWIEYSQKKYIDIRNQSYQEAALSRDKEEYYEDEIRLKIQKIHPTDPFYKYKDDLREMFLEKPIITAGRMKRDQESIMKLKMIIRDCSIDSLLH